jgi:hypothetical protein
MYTGTKSSKPPALYARRLMLLNKFESLYFGPKSKASSRKSAARKQNCPPRSKHWQTTLANTLNATFVQSLNHELATIEDVISVDTAGEIAAALERFSTSETGAVFAYLAAWLPMAATEAEGLTFEQLRAHFCVSLQDHLTQQIPLEMLEVCAPSAAYIRYHVS